MVALPKLSHQNQSCRIAKWLKQPGDAVAMYDVMMEVEADDLVEEVFKVRMLLGFGSRLADSFLGEQGSLAGAMVPRVHTVLPSLVLASPGG